MATSEDGYYTRFSESLLDDGDFCDTGMLRRCLGNLNHLADQCAQNRINWTLPSGVSGFVVDSDLTVSIDTYFADVLDGTVFPLMLWKSPPFDLHVRETGRSYRCMVRVNIHSASATKAAKVRVVLAPFGPGNSASEELAVNGVNVVTSSGVASTSYAWQTISTPLMYLDELMVSRAQTTVSVRNDVGGEYQEAKVIRVELMIAGLVNDLTATATLGGVVLTEYLVP